MSVSGAEISIDSPMPGEGEDGCVFDEIGSLVEPDERPVMGWAA
jgi:hypothetical protein